jgi:hypothetical protein
MEMDAGTGSDAGLLTATARALLGRLFLVAGDQRSAARAWANVPANLRAAVGIAEALPAAWYACGVAAYQRNDFTRAAEDFRSAVELGSQERLLRDLFVASLVQTARQLLGGPSAEGTREPPPSPGDPVAIHANGVAHPPGSAIEVRVTSEPAERS